jgi:hyperosmotically inducible protein
MVARTVGVLVVMLGLSAPAFAQSENLQVFRDVQRQVLRYPHFTIFDSVNAQIDEGVVILSGKVTMPYKREEIERRVRRVRGVAAIDNRLEVLPASQFDDELRIRIARAIYSNPALVQYRTLVNPPIHIIVERGRVTLEGVVNNDLERVVAGSIAGSFMSFEMKNELKTDDEVRAELEKI